MNFGQVIERDARLIILKALAVQPSATLNSTHLDAALQEFGISQLREWLFDQLDWLQRMGAITVSEVGSVRVATLTEKGLAHVERRRLIEGVGRPSLGSVGATLIAESFKSKGE